MIPSISVQKLNTLNNIKIIDIRSVEKYNDNHIPNARNLPFDKLLLYPDKYLNKQEEYYIYCQKGKKSMQLCKILNEKGFKTINILGGYETWIVNK